MTKPDGSCLYTSLFQAYLEDRLWPCWWQFVNTKFIIDNGVGWSEYLSDKRERSDQKLYELKDYNKETPDNYDKVFCFSFNLKIIIYI